MWSLIGPALALLGTLGEDARLAKLNANPSQRIMILMNQSKNLREIDAEMERFWMVDQPSHLTPERVNGGVGQ
jgi:hypothetical protein